MKKTFLIISMLLAVLVITSSCGGGGKPAEDDAKQENGIRPSATKVMGPLKDYFEVVDKAYKIPHESFAKLNVEFKRLGGKFPLEPGEDFVANEYSKDAKKTGGLAIEMTVEFLDEDGNVIDTALSENHELIRLAGCDEGDTGMVSFYLPHGKTPASFRISSEMKHIKAEKEARSKDSDLDELDEAINKELENLDKAMGILDDAAKLVR